MFQTTNSTLFLFLNETLILKGTSALDGRRGGEEGGISCELFTLSQMISFFLGGRSMDCNIESITGRCSPGAFRNAAVEVDGAAHVCSLCRRTNHFSGHILHLGPEPPGAFTLPMRIGCN